MKATTDTEPIYYSDEWWEQHEIKPPIQEENVEKNYIFGWICPKCGMVNAPWVSNCSCSIKREIT